jgi:hypothetical protein
MAGLVLAYTCLGGICIGTVIDTAIYFASQKIAPNTEHVEVIAIGAWRAMLAVGITVATIRWCLWKETPEDRDRNRAAVWVTAFYDSLFIGLFISPTALIYLLVHFL